MLQHMGKIPTMSKVTPCVKAPTNLLKGKPPSNPKPKDGFLLIRQFEHPPAPPCRMLHGGVLH